MNSLFIDTSNNLETKVELRTSKGTYVLVEKRNKPGDQNVLDLMEKILAAQKINIKKIERVDVFSGPGSFTGLRVGAAIANAIGFSLNISVNGKPIGNIALPSY